ncbi:MAG: hypothetical protein GY716_08340 [bacterium]|nr:hypothetical protein [bacterium]
MKIKFGFEGASWNQSKKDWTEAKFKLICAVLKDAAASPKKYEYYLFRWFGARDHPAVGAMLGSLSKYVNEKCSRMTFVSANEKYYGAVFGNIVSTRPEANELGGVHKQLPHGFFETKDDYRKKDGYLKVGSGMRVYLGKTYFKAKKYERVNTLFHELTHRVVMTVDAVVAGKKMYGKKNCMTLSDANTLLAIENADNWGYFMADAIYKMPKGS